MNKTNYLITGSTGFIGSNLINKLRMQSKISYFIIDRNFVTCFPYFPKKIDTVIHLASSHRENESKLVYEYNMKINQDLMRYLERHNLESNIIFASSIQENNESDYGKSKKDGALYIKNKCEEWNKTFTKLILPNVFGPYAKPNHTSVVANFCNNIINSDKSIINDVEINLVFINDVVNKILRNNNHKMIKTEINIVKLYELIEYFHHNYENSKSILVKNNFESQLLSTYLSYR